MLLPHYQPHNILVTGGAGFIGANFIRYLLNQDAGVTIFNLDALTYAGSLKNIEDLSEGGRHFFIQGDICDRPLVSDILQQHAIDTVIHFAAESHVDRSIKDPLLFAQTNVVGTLTLLDSARQYWQGQKKWNQTQCRFHHISTDEVYGSLTAEEAPFTEQSPYAPNSPYSASKAGSDHLVRAYFHTYQLPVTLSHCSNNYGPYQHTEKFIPTIIRACQQSHPIPIYGDGSPIRDWLYVEDHCAGIVKILQQGSIGEAYNLGGHNQMSNLAVAHHICNIMDALYPKKQLHHTLIQFVADRLGHDWRYAINTQKITQQLRWEPKETFIQGIHKTVAFYSSTQFE
ncbi:MAG: dTDP-glucose 4,6-dehydratase [Gammaproteobacteria bacterium]|jgi:dTDP-glucose 4,6-dehydratase|nr:dTDP-glucose 4,6-dehydratase [Gammaproteobacteria bacterium]